MALTEKQKTVLSTVARFLLSIALLVYLYFRIDVAKTAEVLKSASLLYIFYAFLGFLVIHVFLLTRWWIFIRALALNVPLFQAIRYFFIGLFGNLFLPSAIGGDLIKVLGLCNYSPQKPKVVASVLLDRLTGFAGMVVVAILAFVFGYRWMNDFSILLSIAGMAVASSIRKE